MTLKDDLSSLYKDYLAKRQRVKELEDNDKEIKRQQALASLPVILETLTAELKKAVNLGKIYHSFRFAEYSLHWHISDEIAQHFREQGLNVQSTLTQENNNSLGRVWIRVLTIEGWV